jgi:hypothetical protein
MAQQMLRQMPSRFGLNDPNSELDPMGRPPQRTDGPDPGVGVKVPDQIDVQRAREILEELRRRLGEPTRPPLELEYLERLLKRFQKRRFQAGPVKRACARVRTARPERLAVLGCVVSFLV